MNPGNPWRRRVSARSARYEIAVATAISLLTFTVMLALAHAGPSAVSERKDMASAVKGNG